MKDVVNLINHVDIFSVGVEKSLDGNSSVTGFKVLKFLQKHNLWVPEEHH